MACSAAREHLVMHVEQCCAVLLVLKEVHGGTALLALLGDLQQQCLARPELRARMGFIDLPSSAAALKFGAFAYVARALLPQGVEVPQRVALCGDCQPCPLSICLLLALLRCRLAVPECGLRPSAAAAALADLPGLVGAPAIDASRDVITVNFDAESTGPRHFLAALRGSGFAAELAPAMDPPAMAVDANNARVAGAPALLAGRRW